MGSKLSEHLNNVYILQKITGRSINNLISLFAAGYELKAPEELNDITKINYILEKAGHRANMGELFKRIEFAEEVMGGDSDE